MAVLSSLFFSLTVLFFLLFSFSFFFFLFVLDEIVTRGFARLPGKFVCGWLGERMARFFVYSLTDAYSVRKLRKRCSLNSLVPLGLCLGLRMFKLQRSLAVELRRKDIYFRLRFVNRRNFRNYNIHSMEIVRVY